MAARRTCCLNPSPLCSDDDDESLEDDSPSKRRPLISKSGLGAGMFDAVRSALTDTYTQAQRAVGSGPPSRVGAGSVHDGRDSVLVRKSLPPLPSSHPRKVCACSVLPCCKCEGPG